MSSVAVVAKGCAEHLFPKTFTLKDFFNAGAGVTHLQNAELIVQRVCIAQFLHDFEERPVAAVTIIGVGAPAPPNSFDAGCASNIQLTVTCVADEIDSGDSGEG